MSQGQTHYNPPETTRHRPENDMTAFTIKAYNHDGVLLNVSGERDEDECQIERITAADSEIDLFDLIPTRTIRSIADKVDAQLGREARQQSAAARAEQHQWHREFAIA
jgi:hypothetical protein